eukprot:gene42127-biopygen6087
MEAEAQESEVSLSIGPDSSRDVLSAYSIQVDVSKFAQVIRNLISNALKFTSKGGTDLSHLSIAPSIPTRKSNTPSHPTPSHLA